MEELFDNVTNLTAETVKKLKEAVADLSEGEKRVMAMSFCGLLVDTTLAEFGLEENKAWKMLVEAHAFVNEQMGDFKA